MIELPEALTYGKQMKEHLTGKTVVQVQPPSSPHKFCWFNGDPGHYGEMMAGKTVTGARAFGIFAELELEDGVRLAFNDGVSARLLKPNTAIPGKYQLLVRFGDGCSLVFTVSMYGSIICHRGGYDNPYYERSLTGCSPLSGAFTPAYFEGLLKTMKPSSSVKAFLATEQRIPGLGNGALQDILFQAGINPRRKLEGLSATEIRRLYESVTQVLGRMTEAGGRDTEKDLLGNAGGYRTLLSKNTLAFGCPRCHGPLVKENYMGGAVYYCPACQPKER